MTPMTDTGDPLYIWSANQLFFNYSLKNDLNDIIYDNSASKLIFLTILKIKVLISIIYIGNICPIQIGKKRLHITCFNRLW